MTVHAVRIYTAANGPSGIETTLNQFTRVLTDQDSEYGLVEASTDPDNDVDVDYYKGIYRFASSEDLQQIVNAISGAVTPTDWHQIEVHDCNHDVPNSGDCPGWVVDDTAGTVPSGI